MTTYLKNCKKCKNSYVAFQNGRLQEWCKPSVDGIKAMKIISGTSGKDFVFDCEYYTDDETQINMYPLSLGGEG